MVTYIVCLVLMGCSLALGLVLGRVLAHIDIRNHRRKTFRAKPVRRTLEPEDAIFADPAPLPYPTSAKTEDVDEGTEVIDHESRKWPEVYCT